MGDTVWNDRHLRCHDVRRGAGGAWRPPGPWMMSRRELLKLGGGLLAVLALPPARPAIAAPSEAEPVPASGTRYLIINADDLGMTDGINRGIFEAHARGVVTSASLMVTPPSAASALARAREYPALSVGLHVDLTSRFARKVRFRDLGAIAKEVERQLDVFTGLAGTLPTHVDSHHHVHNQFNVAHVFLDVTERHGLPLRGFSPVIYVEGFYGQGPDGKSDLRSISPENLIALAAETGPGLSEIGCHPGYSDPDGDRYDSERQVELETLTDPSVSRALRDASIALVSFRDTPRITAALSGIGAKPR